MKTPKVHVLLEIIIFKTLLNEPTELSAVRDLRFIQLINKFLLLHIKVLGARDAKSARDANVIKPVSCRVYNLAVGGRVGWGTKAQKINKETNQ